MKHHAKVVSVPWFADRGSRSKTYYGTVPFMTNIWENFMILPWHQKVIFLVCVHFSLFYVQDKPNGKKYHLLILFKIIFDCAFYICIPVKAKG